MIKTVAQLFPRLQVGKSTVRTLSTFMGGKAAPKLIYIPPYIKLLNLSKLLKTPLDTVLSKIGYRERQKIHCTYQFMVQSGGRLRIDEKHYKFDTQQKVIIPFEIARKIAFQCIPPSENPKVELLETEPVVPETPIKTPDRLSDRKQAVGVLLGHFNHGKTTLLDALLKSSYTSKEDFGITQEIRGATVPLTKDSTFTLIDTPGQDIFYRMRANGAGVADMAILVVSIEDGICNQTKECISAIDALKLPVIIAMNKVDKAKGPEDVEKLSTELDTFDCLRGAPRRAISAKTGVGLGEFQKLLQSAFEQLKLPSKKDCMDLDGFGTVLDMRHDAGKGVSMLVLMHTGFIKSNMYFTAGFFWGKCKNVYKADGSTTKGGAPGEVVRIICKVENINPSVPLGENFWILSAKKAERLAEMRQLEHSLEECRVVQEVESSDDSESDEEGPDPDDDEEIASVKHFPVLLRADIANKMASLLDAIEDINETNANQQIVIAGSGLGNVNLTDVRDAKGLRCPIFALNVKIDSKAKSESNAKKVKIISEKTVQHILDSIDYHIACESGAVDKAEVSRDEWIEMRND